jgi:hypothetical protein
MEISKTESFSNTDIGTMLLMAPQLFFDHAETALLP